MDRAVTYLVQNTKIINVKIIIMSFEVVFTSVRLIQEIEKNNISVAYCIYPQIN